MIFLTGIELRPYPPFGGKELSIDLAKTRSILEFPAVCYPYIPMLFFIRCRCPKFNYKTI